MLYQTKRIDFITKNPVGDIVVVMTAAEDWSTDEQALEMLSDKIETYVSFIKDPQFREEYGSATASIELVAAHDPTDPVQELLRVAAAATGIEISVRKMELEVGGLLGGGPSGPSPQPTPSPRVAEGRPARSEGRWKGASRKAESSTAGRPSGTPNSLEQVMAATSLNCVELDPRSLAVPLAGERVEEIVVHVRQVDEELTLFEVPLPEPDHSARGAALDNLLRTSFIANYVKLLSGGDGQLLWTVQTPTLLLTPDFAEGVVRSLGQLADVTGEDLVDPEDSRARLIDCRIAQAAHIRVDAESAEPVMRAELKAAGLTITREFDDAVAANFAKVGDMEIYLFSRFHESVIAFIVNLPGFRPHGDIKAYLGCLLELNASATVARTAIDNDGDVAILYEIPGFRRQMFREVLPQLMQLFLGILKVHANA